MNIRAQSLLVILGLFLISCKDKGEPTPPANLSCGERYGGSNYWFMKLNEVGTVQWEKCFDIGASAPIFIELTMEGGYVAAGTNNSDELWVVNLDELGNVVWQKTYASGIASSIRQTTDGGYIISGFGYCPSGNHGEGDYLVLKLDELGNIQWQKCLGGRDWDFAYSAVQTTDGGFVVSGLAYSRDGDVLPSDGAPDYWIVKLDESGNIQWQKVIGGCGEDAAFSIRQTIDGGYIIAGSAYHEACDGQTIRSYDFGIIKLDGSGDIQWEKYIGGSKGERFPFSMGQNPDGGYYIIGTSDSNDGDVSGNKGLGDYWVVTLDVTGNIMWQKSLGGPGYDEGRSIDQTSDGGYILCGLITFSGGDVSQSFGLGDYWIVKLSESGDFQWEKSFGGQSADAGTSIRSTSDKGYIVAGTSSN